MTLKDIVASAINLHDRGWRAKDKEAIKQEYNLAEDEAQKICGWMEKF